MCQAFPLTLTEDAYAWYNELPHVSISLYGQLQQEFITTFTINAPQKKDSTYLISILQRSGKLFRRCINRFRNATLEVHDLLVGTIIETFLQGTTFLQLKESLAFN